MPRRLTYGKPKNGTSARYHLSVQAQTKARVFSNGCEVVERAGKVIVVKITAPSLVIIAVGECSFEPVCRSERGIAAIVLGYNAQPTLLELRKRVGEAWLRVRFVTNFEGVLGVDVQVATPQPPIAFPEPEFKLLI